MIKELVHDLAVAAHQLSQANMSGLGMGFFASLLVMTLAVEVRLGQPAWFRAKPYLVQRIILVSLYITAMHFASVFVSLTLPDARVSQYSFLNLILAFCICLPPFLAVDLLVQAARNKAARFMTLFSLMGILIQFLIHATFIFLPPSHSIVLVHWGAFVFMFALLTVLMGMLSSFAQKTSAGQAMPVRAKVIYIFLMTVLNQFIALTLLGLIKVDVVTGAYSWWQIPLSWSTYENIASAFAFWFILSLMLNAYSRLQQKVEGLIQDNAELDEQTRGALRDAAKASAKLMEERTRIRNLEQSIQLAQSEHQLGVDSLVTALSSLEGGMFEWDLALDTVRLSPTWRRLLGIESSQVEYCTGGDFKRGVLQEDLGLLDETIHATMLSADEGRDCRIRYQTSWGQVLKLEFRMVPVKNSYGLPTKLVGMIYDRTSEMDLERAMQAELDEEALISNRKSQFVKYLAHELRTPMTIISSARALMESTLKMSQLNPDRLMVFTDQIGTGLKSLRKLVDETLMFMTTAHPGRPSPVLEELSLEPLIEESHLYTPSDSRLCTLVNMEISPETRSEKFRGDGASISQVFRYMTQYVLHREVQVSLIWCGFEEDLLVVRVELGKQVEWLAGNEQVIQSLDREGNPQEVIKFEDDQLPFSLLLTKRAIRTFSGIFMLQKNQAGQFVLTVKMPVQRLKKGEEWLTS